MIPPLIFSPNWLAGGIIRICGENHFCTSVPGPCARGFLAVDGMATSFGLFYGGKAGRIFFAAGPAARATHPEPQSRYPADNVPTLVPISCMPGQFAWFRTAAPTVVSNNLLTGPPTPWRSLTKLLYPTNSCRRTKPPFRKASSTAARGGRYMPLHQIARQKFPLLFSVEKTHWNSTVGLHVLPIIDGPTPGQV